MDDELSADAVNLHAVTALVNEMGIKCAVVVKIPPAAFAVKDVEFV